MTTKPSPTQPPLADDPDQLMTTSEIAAATKLDRKTVIRAIRSGDLPAFVPHRGKATEIDMTGSRGGRNGYRAHARDVERWFYGRPTDG